MVKSKLYNFFKITLASQLFFYGNLPYAFATTEQINNFQVLYSFQGGADGANPTSALIVGSDGYLYGTTTAGGASNNGTVFRISPSGSENVIYSFRGGTNDGATPVAGVIQGSDGYLYGTTLYGGINNNGIVFRISPSGVEEVLHYFLGRADGANPQAGLVWGDDGYFYGATIHGGSSDNGTVFKVSPSGNERVIYYLQSNSDGNTPSTLIRGDDGYLYGTTENGNRCGWTGGFCGAVFKISPSGASVVIYPFQGGDNNDGALPTDSLFHSSDGYYYGTTMVGGTSMMGFGGTVFKVSASGSETVLYSFQGGADGGEPVGGLVQSRNGYLYGTTGRGGNNENGTVFKISTSGDEGVIHTFGGADGANPEANLIRSSDGCLYGTTFAGGANGKGVVYKISD